MDPALLLWRRDHERLMTGSCTIVRRTLGAFDPDTGRHAAPTDSQIYTGKCLVRALPADTSVQLAGEDVQTVDMEVRVPHTVDARREDRVTVDTSDDPNLAGRLLLVRRVEHDDWVTHRRLLCEDQQ